MFGSELQLVESSMGFDMEALEPFLNRVMALVPEGFSDAEVDEVVRLANVLDVNEEREIVFPIVHGGEASELRVLVYMEDAEAPDVTFFTPVELAMAIDAEIDAFCDERGI